MDGQKARQAAFVAVLRKLKDGQKLTGADYRFLDEMAALERAARKDAEADEAGEANAGATLEEDLEEWVLRDGVVRRKPRKLRDLAAMHHVTRKELDKALSKIQRRILAQYGWEGAKRSGPLSGTEALALLWAKSISQGSRAFQLWEVMMGSVERMGEAIPMELFAGLVSTLRALQERRDGLVLKVRDLSAKEKRLGTGRGQKAHNISIMVKDS